MILSCLDNSIHFLKEPEEGTRFRNKQDEVRVKLKMKCNKIIRADSIKREKNPNRFGHHHEGKPAL